MIFFDVTKAGNAAHRSGLTRVSSRVREALGASAAPVTWDARTRSLRGATDAMSRERHWFLTVELFSEEERPGFSDFIASRVCRTAAVFHDAIPLKHPHITWPQSVARHPGYLKLLARFDRVWAVSHASRDDLIGFWRWLGIASPPPVEVLPLGADFRPAARIVSRPAPSALGPELLCVGIIEPRKNQTLLLDACEELWREQVALTLHLVGRVNPHFGPPILTRIKSLRRTYRDRLQFHEAADDRTVTALYARVRATVFPTLAEGCGLPLLESLWLGVPCVCSDLPVLRENARDGGCLSVPPNDRGAWKAALRQIATDDVLLSRLTREAVSRPLPTWQETGRVLAAALK